MQIFKTVCEIAQSPPLRLDAELSRLSLEIGIPVHYQCAIELRNSFYKLHNPVMYFDWNVDPS